jgi:hypothetical protein
MSVHYSLICMDCGEVVTLGKAYHDKHERWSFNSLGAPDFKSSSLTDQQQLGIFMHFLVRHRLHKLRLLPETVWEPYENDNFPRPGSAYEGAEGGELDWLYANSPIKPFSPADDSKSLSEEAKKELERLAGGPPPRLP